MERNLSAQSVPVVPQNQGTGSANANVVGNSQNPQGLTNHPSKKIPIMLAVLALALLAAFFMLAKFYNKGKLPLSVPSAKVEEPSSSASAAVETEAPAPKGPLLGIWGKISQIDKADKTETNLATGTGTKAEGKITIQSDSGKKYAISVNGATLVNLYRESIANKTEEVLPEKTNFEFLKVGDRIYLATAADLKIKTSLSADEIKFVEVYRKESE